MNEEYIIEINNVNDFINKVKLFDYFIKASNMDKTLFYRGQSNKEYGVYPSVFRDNNLIRENTLFNKLLLACPDDFIKHSSVYERMTKMQHYGLPTRLLDVTKNPLVALYFACQENKNYDKKDDLIISIKDELNLSEEDTDKITKYFEDLYEKKEKDGEIFIIIEKPFNPDDKKVNILTSLATCFPEKECKVKSFIDSINSNLLSDLSDNDIQETLAKFHYGVVVSGMNNDRIKKQSGAFILFGAVLDYNDGIFKNKDIPFDLKDELTNKIYNNYKEVIESLNAIYSASTEEYEDRELKNIKPIFDEELSKYSNFLNSIENRDKSIKCRFIINANRKYEILQELDKLGINQSTLFPEIDEQAEFIKNNGLKAESVKPQQYKNLIDNIPADKNNLKTQVNESEKLLVNLNIDNNNNYQRIEELLKKYGASKLYKKIDKEIVLRNFFSETDWYNYEQTKAENLLKIKKLLRELNVKQDILQDLANEILNIHIEYAKEIIGMESFYLGYVEYLFDKMRNKNIKREDYYGLFNKISDHMKSFENKNMDSYIKFNYKKILDGMLTKAGNLCEEKDMGKLYQALIEISNYLNSITYNKKNVGEIYA